MLTSEEKSDKVTTVSKGLNRIEIDTRLHLFLIAEEADGPEVTVRRFMNDLKRESDAFNELSFTEELDLADLILLYIKTDKWGHNKIQELRSEPKHFLAPILVLCEQDVGVSTDLIDDRIEWPALQTKFSEKITKLLDVCRKVQDLVAIPDSVGEIGLKKILVLRYLYTREGEVLRPSRNHRSSVGYTFPLAQTLFNVEPGQEFAFLESLEEAQLILPKLKDKVNVCPFCEHTQINFRELCPHCRSLNISEETTIHHFRCAYIGKESEFRQGLQLRCPKCGTELRHIGVDYDKPSEILWCTDCNHNFSEPLLSCFCLACAKTFPPENTLIKQVNEYTLAQDGFRAAEEGALPGSGLINILKKEVGFYKREVFMEMLRIEVSRCRRYKYKSTLSRFNLRSAQTGFKDSSAISRKFKNDFATIINQTFRSTDLFTDATSGDILAILTNTDCDNTRIAFGRLENSINKIATRRIDLDYQLFDLATEEDSIQEIWEKF